MDDISSKSEPVALQDAPVAPLDVQQTPKRSKHKRVNSDDTERPASAQRDRDGPEEHSDIEAEQEVSDDGDADPAEQICDFDWEHLHERYHNAINQCSQEEAELLGEWTSLMEVSSIRATV